MIEITSENFKELYPQLERTLKNANFIAIDTEFTGIDADNIKNSLFDSTKKRYENYRTIVQPYIIVQFGIATYERVPDENIYNVEVFNFYLLPRSIPLKKRQFLCQVSSLEFLSAYGFDFNKTFYKGISYLDEDEQAILQQQLRDNVLLQNMEHHISYKEEDDIKDYSNQVVEWLNEKPDETSSLKIDTPTPAMQYLMHKELRNRFNNIWTFSGNNMITVIKVLPELRKVLEKEEGSILENALLDSYMGFTKVFNLLVKLKKPIIAHNAILDLMFMYKQFYKPLPQKYIDFKNNIHQLFPTIYDTKFLSFELRVLLQTEERWKNNSLGDLFNYFSEKHGKHLPLGSPFIKFSSESEKSNVVANSMMCHNAAWDAYFTGYIFIKMAHIFSTKYYGQGLTLKYFTHTELMNCVKCYANCINIIRASASYLRLDGADPASTRPQWLYVKTLVAKQITAAQIAEQMSKFGAVDVKQFTSKRVLVAVPNHGSARDILQHFKQNKEIIVVPYNAIRHSPSVQIALWSTLVVSSGIFAWMLHQKFQKTSLE